jgi:hypothetical protein
MKTLQNTLNTLIACAAVFLCNSCIEKNHLANVVAIVIAELERLSVVPEADAEIKQYALPEDVDAGADWGLKTIVCEEGGYDLHPYEGWGTEGSHLHMSYKIMTYEDVTPDS